jgi:hypothetical protein
LNGSYKPTPIEDVKEWVSSDEAKQRKVAEAKVGELISIDGILHRKCNSPVLMLHPWRDAEGAKPSWYHLLVYTGDRSVGSMVDVTQVTHVQRPSVTKFFPLSDWDIARLEASAVGVDKPDVVAPPVVHIPDVVNFDRADDVALRTVEFVLSDIKARIGDYSRHVVNAWLDLRDSYIALVNSEGSLDHMMGRLDEFADRLGLNDTHLRNEIELGLEAWKDSSIGIGVVSPSRSLG